MRYFDHNATTPVSPAVAQAVHDALLEAWGNPSSAHPAGLAARHAVDAARHAVAALVGAHDDEVVFVSGGTEANHHAVAGSLGRGPVVTTRVEHPSVLSAVSKASQVRWLEVDAGGALGWTSAAFVGAGLVSVMLANNETGVCHPVAEIAREAHQAGAWMHTDAAQAVGKVPVDFRALDVDLLTIAGHKLYAPKGIGALVVRRGIRLPSLFGGGSQEGGRRAGTEAVPAIVGLGVACSEARMGLESEQIRVVALRDRLETGLCALVSGLRVTGLAGSRLPNTSHLRFPGCSGAALLSATGIAASTGSACHAGRDVASPVLMAMGMAPEDARGAVRLSLGRSTTADDVDAVVQALAAAWRTQRFEE